MFSLVASGIALAQAPRVGLVELYGVRKVSQERIRAAIGVSEGDPLPASKTEIEERLRKVPGVVLARVEAVCCAGEQAVLYVGIEERDAPHPEFRPPPHGNTSLPEAVAVTYHDFVAYFGEAARSGNPSGPAAEAYRESFEHLAREHLDGLRRVLRESDDAEQRAIAACVLGRAPVLRPVVDDLQYAMLDDDPAVRSNAMRSLQAMAQRAARDPDLEVRVELTWFVELLNSLVWDDRTQAATALASLTESRDPRTLDHLRERALPALVEMARWKTPAHARPAFVLVGRLGGVSEQDLEAAWAHADREGVIGKALK